MKSAQRSSQIVRRAWHDHCDTKGGGIRDPVRHDDPFLRVFLQRWHADFGGTPPPPKSHPPEPAASLLPRQRPGQLRRGGGPPPSEPLKPSMWAPAESLARAKASKVWRDPPEDRKLLEAYLTKHRRKLLLLTTQDQSSPTFQSAYADACVLKRMIREGKYALAKLCHKEQRSAQQDARLQLDRATTRTAQLEKQLAETQAALQESRSAAARAREILEGFRGVRPSPMRSVPRSVTSSSSSGSSESSAPRTAAS